MLGADVVDEAIVDPSKAKGEKLRAMLVFLEKMTLTPEGLTAEDGDCLRASGVSEQAITDALNVAYVFAIYNRMADALGWHVMGPEKSKRVAWVLLKKGYV